MFFDGSSCGVGAGIGIVLISPLGENYEFSIPIEKTSTNNQAEYQEVLKGINCYEKSTLKLLKYLEIINS
jgi:ribonuclease HI